MTSSRVTWATGLLLGFAGIADARVGTQAPIIGGVEARADAAVVGLATSIGMVFCTGTIVSPRIVVTAAHCVDRTGKPPLIYMGNDPGAEGMFIAVDSAVVHPDYADRTNPSADIAIVVLERPVTITPVPLLGREPAPPRIASDLRLLGFGETGRVGVLGVKYIRSVPLTGVDQHWLSYGVGACHGDSGGPTLATDAAGIEHLAGVISRGDAACASTGYSTRVDLYQHWLESWIANVDRPICSLDTRCVEDCASPDPDCAIGDEIIAPEDAGCSVGSPGSVPLGVLAFGLLLRRRRS